ncbi:MAG: ThuA domain-containing protein [Phycisphaerae bacterium]
MAKKKAKRKITKKQGRRPSARVKQRTAKTKPRKILMLIGGPLFHPSQQAAELLAGLLQARGGRWEVNATSDYDTLASLPGSGYDAVLIYMTGFRDDLTPEREKGLLDFVKAGGGLVGVHSAADSFRGSRAYIRMLNAEFRTHPRKQPIPVRIVDRDHYLTVRMPDFVVEDELYILQAHDPQKSRILAEATWQGKRMPIAFVHPFGKGRVAYLALGHDLTAWQHPEFQKLLLRSLEWTQGAEVSKREIRCGVLGYGPAFNMGKGHGEWMNATPGLRTVAACDTNPERMKAAKEELPGIRTFESLDAMLKMKDLDLVVNILPHNLHAETNLACLRAGKAIVSEKPFCITTDEATKMIRAAQRAKVMLSVFHNRRWDGDYLAIRDIIARGLLGDVYHIECCSGGYNRPGTWWRSDKTISGGALYDWGAHFTDWILRLVDKRVTQVTGFFHKRLWHHVTNEDAAQAIVRFEDGTMADLQQSSLAAVGKPMWRILGTLGGLVANGKDTVDVTSYASGVKFEGKIPAKSSYGSVEYYRNIADHLLLGEPLAVTAEQGREVIAVIETAERSSAEGRSLPLPAEVYED